MAVGVINGGVRPERNSSVTDPTYWEIDHDAAVYTHPTLKGNFEEPADQVRESGESGIFDVDYNDAERYTYDVDRFNFESSNLAAKNSNDDVEKLTYTHPAMASNILEVSSPPEMESSDLEKVSYTHPALASNILDGANSVVPDDIEKLTYVNPSFEKLNLNQDLYSTQGNDISNLTYNSKEQSYEPIYSKSTKQRKSLGSIYGQQNSNADASQTDTFANGHYSEIDNIPCTIPFLHHGNHTYDAIDEHHKTDSTTDNGTYITSDKDNGTYIMSDKVINSKEKKRVSNFDNVTYTRSLSDDCVFSVLDMTRHGDDESEYVSMASQPVTLRTMSERVYPVEYSNIDDTRGNTNYERKEIE